MFKPFSFLQRSVASILLVSFLLESCWNPSIAPGPIQPELPPSTINYTPDLPKKSNSLTYERSSNRLIPSAENVQESELNTPTRSQATGSSLHGTVDQPSKSAPSKADSHRLDRTTPQKISLRATHHPNVTSAPKTAVNTTADRLTSKTNQQPKNHSKHIFLQQALPSKTAEPFSQKTTQHVHRLDDSQLFQLQQFTAEKGEQIQFMLQPHGWIADIQENLPGDFSRSYKLPVVIGPGMTLASLARLSKAAQKQRIHVIPGKASRPGCVFVGWWGLRGGAPFAGEEKLLALFPQQSHLIKEKILALLENGCEQTSIDALLTYLEATRKEGLSPQVVEQQSQQLLAALDILVAYQAQPAVCKQAFEQIKQKKVKDWEHATHQCMMDATFLQAHERSAEEIIDFIAEHAPGVEAASNKQALQEDYDAIIHAYNNKSSLINTEKHIADWGTAEIRAWAEIVKTKAAAGNLSKIYEAEIVAVLQQAVKQHHDHLPRATQLIALLLLINHADQRGRLAQINTGEGKSLIVAMLAAYHGLHGQTVDVVTTSPELSKREVAKQANFFERLQLTVGENSKEETKKEVYKKDIVYGTATDFQADILRTEFSGLETKGDRKCKVVIVDEVDSMLFDSRNYSVQLSSQLPAMHHLELVLSAVWERVNRLASRLIQKDGKNYYVTEDFQLHDDEITIFSGNPLVQCLKYIEDKEDFIRQATEAHIRQLLRKLDKEEKEDWEEYQQAQEEIVQLEKECKQLQKKVVVQQDTMQSLPIGPASLSYQLHDSTQEKQVLQETEIQLEAKKSLLAERQKEIIQKPWEARYPILEIPNHLREFAMKQIPYWTESALEALFVYRKEVHYDVKAEEIIPVDYDNTGVLQHQTVWGHGLAQMLQIKEGLPITPENISNNFISTVGFFKRYGNKIYGLTGTLGNATTQNFFKEVYGTDLVIVPPHIHREIANHQNARYACKELPAVVVPDQQAWYEAIVRTTLSKVKNQRGVLIICKYIDQVKQLHKQLSLHYDADKITLYTGQEVFSKEKIDAGEIVIATNIAGRGTDLSTTKTVEANGGMHVCITFLPTNYRVELQNAGRTGRQGKKGTAQLVICEPRLQGIEALREIRDAKEAKIIAEAKDDVAEMRLRDELFNRFCSLEAELFPTVSDFKKLAAWNILKLSWEKFKQENWNVKRVEALYQENVANYKKGLHEHILLQRDAIIKKDFSKASAAMVEKLKPILYEKILARTPITLISQEEFFSQQTQNLLDTFCDNNKSVSNDVLQCLKSGKPFELKSGNAALVRSQGWTIHDRRSLEERWGLWLQQALQTKKRDDPTTIFEQFEKFADQVREDADADKLIQNPSYYTLRGNSALLEEQYDAAIAAYDKAISLDPIFTINARYHKAWALCGRRENRLHHALARYELNRANTFLVLTHKPALVGLNLMASIRGPLPRLSEHLEHQVHILGMQEAYINHALDVIDSAQEKEDWQVAVAGEKSIQEIFQDDTANHQKAINKAWINGLTHLFMLKEREPTPYGQIITVAIFGVVQIVVGGLILVGTGGQLGYTLIKEGVLDLIDAVKGTWKGEFDMADWATKKAARLALSLVLADAGSIQDGVKALGNVKDNLSGETLSLATQEIGSAFAQNFMQQALIQAAQWGYEKTLMKPLEAIIYEQVEKTITTALSKNKTVQQGLDLDLQAKSNDWQQAFTQTGLRMFQEKEATWVTRLGEVSKGIVKGLADHKIAGFAKEIGAKNKNESLIFRALYEAPYMAHALKEMLSLTNTFIDRFEEKVKQRYQSTIEAASQVQAQQPSLEKQSQEQSKQTEQEKAIEVAQEKVLIGGEQVANDHIPAIPLNEGLQYNSQLNQAVAFNAAYSGPSGVKPIIKEFTRHLTARLLNQVQSVLVSPALNLAAQYTVEKIMKYADDQIKQMQAKKQQAQQGQSKTYQLNENDQVSEEEGGSQEQNKEEIEEPGFGDGKTGESNDHLEEHLTTGSEQEPSNQTAASVGESATKEGKLANIKLEELESNADNQPSVEVETHLTNKPAESIEQKQEEGVSNLPKAEATNQEVKKEAEQKPQKAQPSSKEASKTKQATSSKSGAKPSSATSQQPITNQAAITDAAKFKQVKEAYMKKMDNNATFKELKREFTTKQEKAQADPNNKQLEKEVLGIKNKMENHALYQEGQALAKLGRELQEIEAAQLGIHMKGLASHGERPIRREEHQEVIKHQEAETSIRQDLEELQQSLYSSNKESKKEKVETREDKVKNSKLDVGKNTQEKVDPRQHGNRSITNHPTKFLDASQPGINFIAKHEGCYLEAYKDIAGLETIGYGHLILKGEDFRNNITHEEALGLLKKDVKEAVDAVNKYVTVELTPNQFDALVSFTFNLGSGFFKASSLLKDLNTGEQDKEKIRLDFLKCDKARVNGVMSSVKGLSLRREREAKLFLEGVYEW